MSSAGPKAMSSLLPSLLPIAEKIAARLIERGETIAVAESSTGGLIAAALLSVPGASAYFVGGAVVYTRVSRAALLGIGDAEMKGMRASTEAYALLCARRIREKSASTWGLGETGATGPSGNRYGDAAGHTCLAVAGPVEKAITLETGSGDRAANMDAFAKRGLELFFDVISART
jgi:nicotinamide-nucleotide amidase